MTTAVSELITKAKAANAVSKARLRNQVDTPRDWGRRELVWATAMGVWGATRE